MGGTIMKRITWILAATMLVAMAAPALAGSGEKCTMATQNCLDYFAAKRDKGWAGLETEKGTAGAIAVKGTVPGSPASKAGFEAGDVLVAMNGAKLDDKDAMKKAKGDWKVGQQVTYTVSRKGAEKQITFALASMPSDVFDRMVGSHMVENHMATATAAASGDAKVDVAKASK
jgi:predicted metalloprotease with PDZ domain